MKIDIHVHTKRVKSGDAETRDIEPNAFCDVLSKTEVKICAITNHNHFDKSQYDLIIEQSQSSFQTWPGVELDVIESNKRGHLIVIVNPKHVQKFADLIDDLTKNSSSDDFLLNLNEVADIFDPLDPIYIPHYLSKKPSISDDEIQILIDASANKKRILKEATNSISAGIFVSHGQKSIYGSDVQDWSDYLNISQNLPDLRLPVESYEQFCLLLDRDDSTIETILDKKNHETITLRPFKEDTDPITIEIYDDINVLFGSKGTGKTEILKALSEYYNNNGYRTSVYESNEVSLDTKYDINGKNFRINLEELEIEPCDDEISLVRNATEESVTSLKKYYEYFSKAQTNKISKRIKIKEYTPEDSQSYLNRFDEIHKLKKKLNDFDSFINSDALYRKIIGDDLFDSLIEILKKVKERTQKSFEQEFVESNTIRLFNNLIETFVTEISRKTGQPEKPIKTGFLDYARNRIKIEVALIKIVSSLNHEFKPTAKYVGDLGEKGKLFFKTVLIIQNGNITDGELKTVNSVAKTPQKAVSKKIKAILKEVYTEELFKQISELNGIENGSTIKSLEDLLLFKRFFEVNYLPYKPSNGESAMILLHQELSENKDIFLIDEPEKSLGNDYINDFIVPLLKKHAYSGKRVIIATHDANIAVRTLPYNSIYRSHAIDCYYTFMGNPFSNSLVCRTHSIEDLDWKETSMRTLEGGREAFGERGKIYAKV
jgi:predicted ATPase